jgi:hypothetical protein
VRIGVTRALNRHVERVFQARSQASFWEKRKLARDRRNKKTPAVKPVASLKIKRPREYPESGACHEEKPKRVTKPREQSANNGLFYPLRDVLPQTPETVPDRKRNNYDDGRRKLHFHFI